MNSADKFVSVLVPTVNRIQDLERFLKSMSIQTFQDFEVIIINRGPISRRLVELCESYRSKLKIKLFREDRGLTVALNLGIKQSKGTIIVRTDDDACPVANWLQEIVKTFGLDSNVGGVTGPSIVPGDKIKNRDSLYFIAKLTATNGFLYTLLRALYLYIILERKWFHPGLITKSGATTWGGAFESYNLHPSISKVMFMSPVNMAVRRDVLDSIGLFDENYRGIGTYSEPDLAYRILRQGYSILYNPKAIVYHHVSKAGVFSLRLSTFDEGYNFVYFFSRSVLPLYGLKCLPNVLLYATLISGYWFHLFRRTRKMEVLGGFAGIVCGLLGR